jgi:predicted transcriptional regulator
MFKSVAEVFSPVTITRRANDLVGQVRDDMLEAGIHCVPIVDDGGVPIGIVSSWDLVDEYQPMEAISNAMTPRVIAIGAHEPLQEAAREMRNNYVHHLVVVDDVGSMIGVISSMDLLDEIIDN